MSPTFRTKLSSPLARALDHADHLHVVRAHPRHGARDEASHGGVVGAGRALAHPQQHPRGGPRDLGWVGFFTVCGLLNLYVAFNLPPEVRSQPFSDRLKKAV